VKKIFDQEKADRFRHGEFPLQAQIYVYTRNMPKSSSSEECLACLCLASRKAARALTRAYDRKLRPAGMRATQFSLLVLINGFGPITIGKLAEVSATERTTLTRNLALLEAAEWVRVQAGEDARERSVSLTNKGAAALERARPLWREAQTQARTLLGEAGAASLLRVSEQVN